ncbi:hypothetical protein N0V88_003824 [Collariella sp. IMI 366227]|nr:hypothetical protein N0V88_003824 [Collariella sp. IMI 366227]
MTNLRLLHLPSVHPTTSPTASPTACKSTKHLPITLSPRVLHSPRGGLTTYHGPGQTVLWPVLDLHSPNHKQFTVKCYARLLETTTISTLQSLFGLSAFTNDDPGVWVRSTAAAGATVARIDRPRGGGRRAAAATIAASETTKKTVNKTAKIAALGVHLRRYVSALGTAVNVTTPSDVGLGAGVEGDESTNPWKRIVASWGMIGANHLEVVRAKEAVKLMKGLVDEAGEGDESELEEERQYLEQMEKLAPSGGGWRQWVLESMIFTTIFNMI